MNKQWRCFHCDEIFDDLISAREHFGPNEMHEPACQIDIAKYREMENLFARSRDEDSDLHRQMYAMESRHQIALRREEEKGYAKGLADPTAPTQGADARPVAIYQIRAGAYRWDDVTKDAWEDTVDNSKRIVYATRNAAPRVEAIEDQPIAWGEWDTQIGKRRRLMMASVDKESGCRVRLYDHPERDAAPSDGSEFRESVTKLVDDMLTAWISNVPISQCSGISARVNALLKDRAASAPMEKT